MSYVDGFVLLVPQKRLKEYQKIAKNAGKVWMEHGALDYKECVAEDTKDYGFCQTFNQLAKPKKGEVVVFSYIVYKNRAHRDKVNAKVMKDKRISEGCDPNNMPFDCARMAYGGFEAIVEYKQKK
jgi:uncharacterized protein YbaA (DUF1428 family)